jgi:hypothetical protein
MSFPKNGWEGELAVVGVDVKGGLDNGDAHRGDELY